MCIGSCSVRSRKCDDVLLGFPVSLAAIDELIYRRGDRFFNRHAVSLCEGSQFPQCFLIKLVYREASQPEFHYVGGCFHALVERQKLRAHKKIFL